MGRRRAREVGSGEVRQNLRLAPYGVSCAGHRVKRRCALPGCAQLPGCAPPGRTHMGAQVQRTRSCSRSSSSGGHCDRADRVAGTLRSRALPGCVLPRRIGPRVWYDVEFNVAISCVSRLLLYISLIGIPCFEYDCIFILAVLSITVPVVHYGTPTTGSALRGHYGSRSGP